MGESLTEERITDQADTPAVDNNENVPAAAAEENAPAPQPNEIQEPANEQNPDAEAAPNAEAEPNAEKEPKAEAKSDAENNSDAKPDPKKGKYGKNFVDPVKRTPDNKDERNEFLRKEYVDTYKSEKAYDKMTDEEKQEMLAKMGSDSFGGAPDPDGDPDPDGAPAPGSIPAPSTKQKIKSTAKGLAKSSLGIGMNGLGTLASATGLAMGTLRMKGKVTAKDSAKASIATNTVGLALNGVSAFKDTTGTVKAIKNRDAFSATSSGLKAAGDVLKATGNVSGITGSTLNLYGKDRTGIGAKTANILSAAGHSLSLTGDFVDLTKQHVTKKRVNALDKQAPGHKHRDDMAKAYSKTTNTKRLGSVFNTGIGTLNLLASGLAIAGNFVSDKKLAAILGIAGAATGLLGRGISWLNMAASGIKKKHDKNSIVNDYIEHKKNKVERHNSAEIEGDLSDTERENIAIARMGFDVTDFTGKSQKDTFKDQIFKRIGDSRVNAARNDEDLLKAMGLGTNASDEAIRNALGY